MDLITQETYFCRMKIKVCWNYNRDFGLRPPSGCIALSLTEESRQVFVFFIESCELISIALGRFLKSVVFAEFMGH
jgi:hypothetical protein